MSSAFARAMLQISIESGEVPKPEEDYDHSRVGAEEITIVTDNTQTELEEAVEETATVVEKLEERDAAADKIVEAADCLESQLVQLRAERAAGRPLTGFSVSLYNQLMASSLEAREVPAGIFEESVLSLQSSFESGRFEDYTTEAEEKTEGLLSRLINMVKKAAESVWTFIKEFFTTIGRSGSAIKAGGAQLKRQASSVKGELKKTEAKGSSYNLLVAEGGFNASKAVGDVISGYESVAVHEMKQFREAIQPFINSAVTTPTVAGVNGSRVGTISASSHALPGGYTAKTTVGAGTGLDHVLSTKFTIEAPSSKAGPEKVSLLAGSEVGSLGDQLVKLGDLLIRSKSQGDQIVKDTNKDLAEVEKALKGIKTDDAEGKAAARALVTKAVKAVKLGKTIIPTYLDFAQLVGKQAYNFGRASLGAHGVKKEEKAPDDAGKKGDDDNK